VEFNIENETRNGKGKMTPGGEKHAENTREGSNKEKTDQIVVGKGDIKQKAPQRVPGDPGCDLSAHLIERRVQVIRNLR